MIFSSTVFLFLFLPAVWLLHAILPQRFLTAKNFILAVASLIFYAYGEPVYIIVMLCSVFFNYVFARTIPGRSEKMQNFLCALCVVTDLLILGFFKYVPWLVTLVNGTLSVDIPVPGIVIPVGISFYTFQILSYVVDVRRGKAEAQTNFLDLLLYISFFPQLIAGPIVKYGDIKEQLHNRTMTADKTAMGIRRFIYGLSKKVLISNTAAVIAEAAFKADEPSSLFAWAGAICYCIQLYFDFSGYSDMAIGLAHMFGFSLLENFNYPYSAVTIRDFWKRWHISLTSWFREYVYFSLGGNRAGKARTIVNRLIVFFLTGLWHGANFTYVLWGMWHGLLMMFEQLVDLDKWSKKAWLKPILHIYTLMAVMLGFVVFNSPSVAFAFDYIGRMFSFAGSPADALGYFSPFMCMMLELGVIFSLPVVPALRRRTIDRGGRIAVVGEAVSYICCVPLFALCIMQLASSSFNPFIYYIF
ncbi:MAG: MBOAT family protein [Clostridia bacterium]|nr:MBOAT family protein [Clostridia bacterium]